MHRCLAQTVLFLSGKLKYIILEVMNMRKMLKENKGFSLVELLVAILIMAVIAGTAITLFGGVMNSSRQKADEETAESIKRAILTYMNLTNDTDLDCLMGNDGNVSSGASKAENGNSDALITALGMEVVIANGTNPATAAKSVTFTKAGQITAVTEPADLVGGDASDFNGTFGPFLDLTKSWTPKQPEMTGWAIEIDPSMQVVTVEAAAGSAKTIIDLTPGT